MWYLYRCCSFRMLLVVAPGKFVEALDLYGAYSNFWCCVRLCIRISGTLFECFSIAYLSPPFLLMLCASCFYQSISSSFQPLSVSFDFNSLQFWFKSFWLVHICNILSACAKGMLQLTHGRCSGSGCPTHFWALWLTSLQISYVY